MNRYIFLSIFLVLFSFLIGIFTYQILPDKIASHWNSNGVVDNYLPKFWGVFLFPLINLIVFLFFSILPKIDPLKKNIENFKEQLNLLIFIFVIFMTYTYILTILWNLNFPIDMNLSIIPAIGTLIIIIGIILRKIKRNWFIGVRTPWSLSSDEVWEKTHNLASTLFILSGILIFLSLFFIKYLLWFILVPIITSAIISIVSSFIFWKQKRRI